MIISASRRGDIPAFLGEWFMERLRNGTVDVAHPFRPRQSRPVSLRREDVDAFVFWSRDPRPFLRHLPEIERRGYPYYFLLTATGYPRSLEPAVPAVAEAVVFFKELAGRIGRRRVVWRYDPVFVTPELDVRFHGDNFSRLCGRLSPHASRAIVSFFDPYPKALSRLSRAGIDAAKAAGSGGQQRELLERFAAAAAASGMEIQTCAEAAHVPGAPHGKCIDDELLNEACGLEQAYRKDPGQRRLCRCQRSIDIGSYGACRHGCLYCYAR